MPKDKILTFEEIAQIVRVGADLGITRLRITGGEPLLRKDLHKLVAMLRGIDPIEEIALTTNALLLGRQIDALISAGVTQISISIDSAHRESFEEMTGVDALETVQNAIRQASQFPVRIELNAVAVRGKTEVMELIDFSREVNVPIRFIELMPFEDVDWDESLLLSGAEIEEVISSEHDYEEIDRSRPAAPSRRFRFNDNRGGFGLIEPVTNPFCSSCDRLRLRSDGMLYNCLFGRVGYDLRNGDIREGFLQAVREKGRGGMLDFTEQVKSPARIMASIGG